MKVIRTVGQTAFPDYMYVKNEEAHQLVNEDGTHIYANKGALRHSINKMEKVARAKWYAHRVERGKVIGHPGTKEWKRRIAAQQKEERKKNPSPARRAQLAAEARNKKRKSRK